MIKHSKVCYKERSMKNWSFHTRWIVLALTLLASFAALPFSLGTQAVLAAGDGASVHDYTVMFTKWVTESNPTPPPIAYMAGIVTGGDAGTGTYAGEVLLVTKGDIPEIWKAEALYQIYGTAHS